MKDAGQPRRASVERIGRYEVLEEIASGGMATVYLGRSQGLRGFSRLVAIKRLHPHLLDQDDFVSMFLDEARLAARIRHPNVVATLDVDDQDGLYLVMEYIEGDRLLGIIRSTKHAAVKIPTPIVLRIATDLLSGLHAAHDLLDEDGSPLNIVHRDVSPPNVLVGFDGITKLTDFGIAKAASQLTTTREGQLKGKIAYMAPEQAAGDPVDRTTDVFASGIVLWEMLTARRLFKRDNDVATLNAVLSAKLSPVASLVPDIDPAIDGVVMRALERHPSDRWPTAAAFADALDSAARNTCGLASTRDVAEFAKQYASPKKSSDRSKTERTPISASAPMDRSAPPSADRSVVRPTSAIASGSRAHEAPKKTPGDSPVPAAPAPAAAPAMPRAPMPLPTSSPARMSLFPLPTDPPRARPPAVAAPTATSPTPLRAVTPPPMRAMTPPPMRVVTPSPMGVAPSPTAVVAAVPAAAATASVEQPPAPRIAAAAEAPTEPPRADLAPASPKGAGAAPPATPSPLVLHPPVAHASFVTSPVAKTAPVEPGVRAATKAPAAVAIARQAVVAISHRWRESPRRTRIVIALAALAAVAGLVGLMVGGSHQDTAARPASSVPAPVPSVQPPTLQPSSPPITIAASPPTPVPSIPSQAGQLPPAAPTLAASRPTTARAAPAAGRQVTHSSLVRAAPQPRPRPPQVVSAARVPATGARGTATGARPRRPRDDDEPIGANPYK